MLISFDSKAYLISRINRLKNKSLIFNNIGNSQIKLLGSRSGPQSFVSDLINVIDENNYAKTTFNFLNSDIHLLNSGSYSKIWKYLKPKTKKRIILRLDGIGIDINNQTKKNIVRQNISGLIKKTENIIYQTEFSRNCFLSTYGNLQNGKVINNGAIEIPLINLNYEKILTQLNSLTRTKYFIVAGRYIGRKRIKEVIEEFDKNDLGYLVVLSDVPNSLKFKNEKIIYLGMVDPLLARLIISRSKALIHFDRYDWCPNVVVWALYDGIPVICSNYGGTPEIASKQGLILKEFPENLPESLEGINFVESVRFPSDLFVENILDFNKSNIKKFSDKKFSMNKTALKYLNYMNKVLIGN